MKVYLVMQSSDDGYDSCPDCVFLNEEKANKYVELNKEIESPYYKFYVRELETSDEKVNLDSKVFEYYTYYIGTDPFDKIDETSLQSFLCMSNEEYNKLTKEEIKEKLEWANHPDNRWTNSPEDKEKRIDDGDLTILQKENYISVYSKKSFNEAREVALNLWNKEKGVLK